MQYPEPNYPSCSDCKRPSDCLTAPSSIAEKNRINTRIRYLQDTFSFYILFIRTASLIHIQLKKKSAKKWGEATVKASFQLTWKTLKQFFQKKIITQPVGNI